MSKYVGFRLGKVHESHVISEYYCGGCGWPVTDHDSFCPECGGAFRECDASNLEAENAKLRGARDVWQENDAKLRELVRYAYECAIHSDHATCDDCRRMNGYCILERRMRELGIEVDE